MYKISKLTGEIYLNDIEIIQDDRLEEWQTMYQWQLIANYNLVSTTTVSSAERKVEIPVLTHLPLSAFSNIGWCIRSNNATAQQFSRIKINVIVEEI